MNNQVEFTDQEFLSSRRTVDSGFYKAWIPDNHGTFVISIDASGGYSSACEGL